MTDIEISENEYIVEIADQLISCRHPDGTTENVSWDELRKIEIITTDEGPFVEDVFWVLHGDENGCIIPQGAKNSQRIFDWLEKLQGVNNEEIIKAMGCATNNRFLIWEKGNFH